ncbi:MAG: hypothetical protein ILP19_01235 [Oscillospiraceae bacterium]|nr:hypothetical protein [Oscillospiraceae bacterium]
MHFSCKCGYVFHDTTDNESFKGWLLADEDLDEFADIIQAGDNAPPEGEHWFSDTYDRLITQDLFMRTIFQCPECGRIFIDDPDDPRLFCCFAPEGNTKKELFISEHRKSGYITADWWDDIRYPEKHKGTINISRAAITGDTPSSVYFDDRDDLEQRYHELVQRLNDKGILRWASLRINGKEIHSYIKRD